MKIVLILKGKEQKTVTKFLPISLCNVCYNIISKVIANRLKHFLAKIIYVNQSAFIPSRLITDNFIVTYEFLHLMKISLATKGFASLRIDMIKAYDTVEWAFICNMMRQLGFSEKWIHRINMCLSSVSFQILINGECSHPFTPSWVCVRVIPFSLIFFSYVLKG